MKSLTFIIPAFLVTFLVFGWVKREIHYRAAPVFCADNCIRALVGEYAVQDYEGMKLMAHAIRNRKTLRGVYGFYGMHTLNEPKEIWQCAYVAWFDSVNEADPLNGASEWRSKKDIKNHGYPQGFDLVKSYGGILYFKKSTKTNTK